MLGLACQLHNLFLIDSPESLTQVTETIQFIPIFSTTLINVVFSFLQCDSIVVVFVDWKYSSGFVSDQMIKENLPAPEEGTVILMCGPPPMINFACVPNLDKLGYSPSMRYSY